MAHVGECGLCMIRRHELLTTFGSVSTIVGPLEVVNGGPTKMHAASKDTFSIQVLGKTSSNMQKHVVIY